MTSLQRGDEITEVELLIGGMTCASCANRVERKLNKLDGVTATVNYATEKARVSAPGGVDVDVLVAQVEAAGYTARPPAPPVVDLDEGPEAEEAETPELRSLRERMLGSIALSVPVIATSMVPALQFTYWQWIALSLTGPVVVWAAWPFHRAAAKNLRHGAATMDTLVSMGVLAAFLWSIYALLFGTAGVPGMTHAFTLAIRPSAGASDIYLEVAAGVTTFLLVGRYIEARSKRRAGAALRALLRLGAKEATVLRGGTEVRVPVGELAVGEEFVVRPGEKVATDGVVVRGTSALDLSLLTGESVPVEVGPGAGVPGAVVNAGGRLVVRATRVGADTQLAQTARLVEDAQAGKADVQRLADRVSGVFVPIVITIAAATLGFWLGTGVSTTFAFTAAVAVLIVACPCALGLATPTALLVGTGRGAQLGVLIKGPEVLESTREVDTVVLDKTGTVTEGRMSVVAVHVVDGESEDEALGLAGAAESGSEHPIAVAITRAARDRGPVPEVAAFTNRPGLGVQAEVGEHGVLIGRPALLAEWCQPLPDELVAATDAAEERGHTAVALAWDGTARAVVVVSDTVRPTSAKAAAQLRRLGLHPVLLTGDNERAARAVAEEVGIDEVIAGVLPADKVDVIKRLQDEGRVVAMVGDGVNDAAALAQADLGLAMGSGTDVAIEAGDITLMRGDLRAVSDAIRLSRRTLSTIQGNLFWAFGYNVAAIPLAAMGLLNPMLAGAAMAISSVCVVLNSLRLRTFR